MSVRKKNGTFAPVPQTTKDEIVAAKAANPKVKVEELVERFGLNRSTINTILRQARGNEIGAKGFSPEQEASLIALWEEKNTSVRDFMSITGLSKFRVETLLKKYNKAPSFDLTPEKEEAVLRLKREDPYMKHREIADIVGIKKDVMADIVAKHNLPPPKYRKGQWTRIPKLTDDIKEEIVQSWDSQDETPVTQIAQKLGVGVTSVRRALEEKGIALDRKLITPEVEERILAIRNESPSTTLYEIAEKVGYHIDSVKKVIQKHGAYLTPEQSQLNALRGQDQRYEENLPELKARLKAVAAQHGGVALGEYESSKTKVRFVCKNGHEFSNHPNGVFSGQWCPYCVHRISKGELEVKAFVEGIYLGEVIGSNRSVIAPMELDIYVPERNLAIEYSGLYWHSSMTDRAKGDHHRKALACRQAGVKLFAVFDDEWKNKQPLVKSMIARRLGCFGGEKLDARKLSLKDVSPEEAAAFFEEHHLGGGVRCSSALGLFLGDKLVACAGFRTNFNREFELARMATHQDYLVRGGAGRLLSKVDRPLISFSDNRVGDGEVYQKLGFRLLQENGPSYWYTDHQTRIWRWKCRRINDPEILAEYPTEESQCRAGIQSMKIFGDNRPLYKIEDYGHRKWVLDK